jgi:type VI protein secretion system component VasF
MQLKDLTHIHEQYFKQWEALCNQQKKRQCHSKVMRFEQKVYSTYMSSEHISPMSCLQAAYLDEDVVNSYEEGIAICEKSLDEAAKATLSASN